MKRIVERNKINKLNKYNKGWLEALIDGEGSLSLIKENKRKCSYTLCPILSIANTNTEFLDRACKIIGGGKVYKCGYGVNKPIYRYFLCSSGLRILLPQLKLIVKEKQRILLLKALKYLAIRDGRFGTWNQNKYSKELIEIRKRIYYLNTGRKDNGKV